MAFIVRLDENGDVIPAASSRRPSRYRVRWRTPAGKARSRTFTRAGDARQWLTHVEGSKLVGGYVDRRDGAILLGEWFDHWISTRRTSSGQLLRPKTVALYRHTFDKHIRPELGAMAIRDIAPSDVRSWHAGLPGATVPAKAYRLLRAVLNTAVDDELIVRNPCRVQNAGVERSPERPVPSGDEVWQLADLVDDRWRALVLTSAFCGLRWGELMGLQRGDVDLGAATVRVERQVIEVDGEQVEGPPKTDAGRRTVAMPLPLVPELRRHLETYTAPDPAARVFVGVKGTTPRATNFGTHWRAVRAKIGRNDLHFHDLRHFSNTLAASTGASTKELMARMGHSSPAAALRYQHATAERDRAIADRMSELLGERRTEQPRHVRVIGDE
ncbi:MAG: site-specific integrase [Acidimicrobiaceae bacterium]|nr:site-specific integrase [Acidimicrobiaceae bacterium]